MMTMRRRRVRTHPSATESAARSTPVPAARRGETGPRSGYWRCASHLPHSSPPQHPCQSAPLPHPPLPRPPPQRNERIVQECRMAWRVGMAVRGSAIGLGLSLGWWWRGAERSGLAHWAGPGGHGAHASRAAGHGRARRARAGCGPSCALAGCVVGCGRVLCVGHTGMVILGGGESGARGRRRLRGAARPRGMRWGADRHVWRRSWSRLPRTSSDG
jgi:hypothetical protein